MAKHPTLKFLSVGGLDMDSRDNAVAPEDYRNAENMRNSVTYKGQQFVPCNMKGNVLVAYNLTSADCRCLGGVEDKEFNTILYFVWSSDSKHKILRYYPTKVSNGNPNGVIELVIEFDFQWSKGERITGVDFIDGKLLYWTDSIKPRMINAIKGNNVNKFKDWTVYLPVSYNQASNFQIVVKDIVTGVSLVSQQVNIPGGNRDDAFIFIANTINNVGNPIHNYLSAEACDCKLTITEKAVNHYNILFTLPDFKVVPENWYGINLIDRFFDACKYPNLNNPLPEYKKDTNILFNFVKNKVLFFRVGYDYDNFEESALSPISNVIINNLNCEGTVSPSYNYIDVDFNDVNLLDPNIWVILKKVTLYVKEHNVGNWREVIELTPCDFFDKIGNNEVAHYPFYNNVNTLPVATTFSEKEYDNLPRTANGQKFAKNKLSYAGVVEGYNEPDCLKADYTIDFVDQPNPVLYKVTIRCRVLSFGLNDSAQSDEGNFFDVFPNFRKYPFWEIPTENYNLRRGGIFHDTSVPDNFAFFGGGQFGTGAGGDFGITTGVDDATAFDQRLPEAGFVIYLAGTPRFGITRQITTGLQKDLNGALDTSTAGNRTSIGKYLYCGGGGTCSDLYSEVTLYLPAGEYVARVASHWCSFGDKLGKGFMYDISAGTQYQKTSTNVWGVLNKDGFTWDKEKEIKFTVTNADIPLAGTFVIMDLTPPFTRTLAQLAWKTVNAYLYDAVDDNGDEITDPNAEGFDGIPIEKALVKYDAPKPGSGQLDGAYDEICTTDHNGYFFGICDRNPYGYNYPYRLLYAWQVNNKQILNTTTMFIGSLTDLFKKTLSAFDFNGTNDSSGINNNQLGIYLTHGIVVANMGGARKNCSTIVRGSVVDSNGNSVGNGTVVYESGRADIVDEDGNYSFVAFGDMVTPNIPHFPNQPQIITDNKNRVVDGLIFSLPGSCLPIYPNGQELLIAIDPFGTGVGQYNPLFPFIVPNFIIDEQSDPKQKAHKRGGKYKYVGRLYDAAGRFCSCFQAFEIYVPFITEDLHKTLPNQYPAGTFKYGKPTINWSIDPTTVFPSWVKSFQWMRTKNSVYGRYLQWIANEVIYLSAIATTATPEIETNPQNQDAVAIKISLRNINTYAAYNPNSLVQYQYQAGDRLRLIGDRFLNPINGPVEFEIVGFDLATLSVIINAKSIQAEIKSGTLFEIYNSKSVETLEEEIFYEVGEVIPVNNGVLANYSGSFKNGDTYWRGRAIIVNDDVTNFSSFYEVIIEDGNVSDFFLSPDQDLGRTGIISVRFRELYRGGSFRISDQYIPETGINGLNQFNDIDDVELGTEFGPIRKLEVSGFVMVAVCENKIVSNYLGAVQGVTPEGQMNVSSQQGYIGDSRPLIGDFGTQHPATVVEKDGWIWGVDFGRGIAWKYDNNGIDILSDKKAMTYFNELSQAGIWDAVGAFDSFYQEYIVAAWKNKFDQSGLFINYFNKVLTISVADGMIYIDNEVVEISLIDVVTSERVTAMGAVTDVAGNIVNITFLTDLPISQNNAGKTGVITRMRGEGKTIAYQKQKQRWTTFYSYLPDNMSPVGFDLVTWKNGQLYLHDVGPIGTFYGVYYKWKLKLCAYMQGYPVLLWLAVYLEQKQNDQDKVNNWSVPVITNELNQLSRIVKPRFEKLEEYWNAWFAKDLNTLSAAIPILDGKDLRSSVLVLEMENDATEKADLRSTNILVTDSSGNT